jgi:hypothetical protein
MTRKKVRFKFDKKIPSPIIIAFGVSFGVSGALFVSGLVMLLLSLQRNKDSLHSTCFSINNQSNI